MIGYIKGKIIHIQENKIIILTDSGVGYEVWVPTSYLKHGDIACYRDIELFTKTITKEDTMELYGFFTPEEKSLFVKLIGISKLGPKSGLTILSHMSPEDLYDSIYREDIPGLTKVPGIGNKTAKRIVLELKEKLHKNREALTPNNSPLQNNTTYIDALSGLKNLGYREEEVDTLLREILIQEPDLMVEETIRNVLKKLARSHE